MMMGDGAGFFFFLYLQRSWMVTLAFFIFVSATACHTFPSYLCGRINGKLKEKNWRLISIRFGAGGVWLTRRSKQFHEDL